jgi:hypothetical protein
MDSQQPVGYEIHHPRALWGMVVIAAGAIALVWWGWQFIPKSFQSGPPPSHQFVGKVTATNADNSIIVYGTYILDANPSKSDYNYPHFVRALVDAQTKFLKTAWDSAAKKNQTQPGSETDLKNNPGLVITIKTIADTIGQPVIAAAEIDYTLAKIQTYSLNGTVVAVASTSITYNTVVPRVGINSLVAAQKVALIGPKTSVKLSAIKVGADITVYYSSNPFLVPSLVADRIEVK